MSSEEKEARSVCGTQQYFKVYYISSGEGPKICGLKILLVKWENNERRQGTKKNDNLTWKQIATKGVHVHEKKRKENNSYKWIMSSIAH